MKQILRSLLGTVLCTFLMTSVAFAQNITVKGTVTDANGAPIPGAFVAVQNTTNGTVTDLDGNYSISVAPNATFEVSFMGYVTEIVPVGGKTTINVTLNEDAESLEATVVIGYGTARRSDVTGSIASVGGETLREIPANDITHALAGRVAGVQMTQTSTKPGSSMQIRIRGTRSLSASNDPLIILDGVPYIGNLTDISTNDIKSLDILKDAASTAIYGSRGANGVILITTYKGVEGQDARVSFNAYTSVKNAVKFPMMNNVRYAQVREMAGKYSNTIFEDNNVNTDWQDLQLRKGLTQNYELSVTGGTKTGNYRFGTTYYKDQGVIPTQAYDRIALNGSLDQRIGKWFRIGFTTNTNYSTNQGGQVSLGLRNSPLVNPYDADGNLLYRFNLPSDNDYYVWTRERIEEMTEKGVYNNESYGFGSYNNGYVQFNFPWIEGLSYKASVGLNYRLSRSGSFTGVGVNGSASAPNSASWSYSDNKNWSLENLLTYDRTFAEKHHLNIVGLYSAEKSTNQGQGLSGKNIPNELFQWYNIGACLSSDITVRGGSFTQTQLISYMARLMYTYDDKYMISAAIRSDASSRLAPGHQWHTYPAVSIGWNINKENFMAGTKNWLDELKLRAGFGETSNQAISAYSTLGTLSSTVYNFGPEMATGYYVTQLPNSNLGWEYSQTWNFGLDFSFFKGRLRGSAEYYLVDTRDILLNLNLPNSSGVSSYTANIGNTQNKGFELTLNGTIIDRGDWTWTAGMNFYINHNKLVSLADGQMEDISNNWFVGYPIDCLYDWEYDGLWQEGDPYMDILEPSTVNPATGYKDAIGAVKVKYHGPVDENGAPTRQITEDDKVPISVEPIFQGGFNTAVAWKNLDLSVIGSFQAGGILVSALHTSQSDNDINYLNGRRGQIEVDFWTPENPNTKYPRPGSLSDNDMIKYHSTLGHFNGTYLKINTISLGYNFHKINALKQAGISNLRLYATIQNPDICLFSEFHKECGLDPITNTTGGSSYGRPGRVAYVGNTTPTTRDILLGLKLTF